MKDGLFLTLAIGLLFASTADIVLYDSKTRLYEPYLIDYVECMAINKQPGAIFQYIFLGASQPDGNPILNENLIHQRCQEFIHLLQEQFEVLSGRISIPPFILRKPCIKLLETRGTL